MSKQVDRLQTQSLFVQLSSSGLAICMIIDRKMRWVARIFFVAFSFVLIRMLFVGGHGYTSAGVELYASMISSPIKYGFGLI